MKVLALFNLKGGVGKTTAAVHLAHLCAAGGRPTLLWDLDPQGAASWYFRVRVGAEIELARLLADRATLWGGIRGSDWPDLDVLPANLSLRKLEAGLRREPEPERVLAEALAALGTRYERVVLDCPPSLTLLTECVFRAAHALVVPTIPTALSLRTLAALHRHVRPHRRRGLLVLPFFSLVDARKAQHREVRAFAHAQGLGFLEAEIPYSAQIESSAARREPLTVAGSGAPAESFAALQREIEQHLADLGPGPKLHRGRLTELVQGLQRARRPGAEERAP